MRKCTCGLEGGLARGRCLLRAPISAGALLTTGGLCARAGLWGLCKDTFTVSLARTPLKITPYTVITSSPFLAADAGFGSLCCLCIHCPGQMQSNNSAVFWVHYSEMKVFQPKSNSKPLLNLCNNFTWGKRWLFYWCVIYSWCQRTQMLCRWFICTKSWREERIEEELVGLVDFLFLFIAKVALQAIWGWQDSRGAGKHKVSGCLCCVVAGESCFTPVWEEYFVALSHG